MGGYYRTPDVVARARLAAHRLVRQVAQQVHVLAAVLARLAALALGRLLDLVPPRVEQAGVLLLLEVRRLEPHDHRHLALLIRVRLEDRVSSLHGERCAGERQR